jgi:lysophospholipase L1-like esterase
VGNFAIPGDSSAYGRLLFQKFAAQFQSDIVILGFGANDAKTVFTSHTDQVARFSGKKGLLAVAGWLRFSALYRVLETVAASKTSAPPAGNQPKVHAVAKPIYQENLRAMGKQAKDLGNKNVLLLTLCTPSDYARSARGIAHEEGYLWFNGQRQLIKALPALERGELYPDYIQKMRSEYPEYLERDHLFYITSDGCHPNELGHRFVADNLARIIDESGLIN